jgi:hypothetical protein
METRMTGGTARIQAAIFACIVVAMTSAAKATEPATNPSLTKNWVFEAGAIFQHLDGDATSEGSLTGGKVRFSQIGLGGTETVPYLAMRWRFADDWRFDFNFTSLDASGSKGNNSDFEFGHSTFPLGYQLNSKYDQQVYTSSIGYSFIKDNQTEFGGRFGLSVLHAEVSLKGSAWVGAGSVTAGPEEAGNTWVVPTLGLYGTYALSNQWTIDGSFDGMAFSYEGYKGYYIAATANLTYWFTDMFAVAAGYRYIDADLQHDGSNWDEEIQVRTSGPVVKATVGF